MGKLFMLTGSALLLIGLVLQYIPGLLSWFGKLPGDIRIENPRGILLIPITSMLLISVILSFLLNLFGRR
jgi:Protein of unknown function (DUF2905)